MEQELAQALGEYSATLSSLGLTSEEITEQTKYLAQIIQGETMKRIIDENDLDRVELDKLAPEELSAKIASICPSEQFKIILSKVSEEILTQYLQKVTGERSHELHLA